MFIKKYDVHYLPCALFFLCFFCINFWVKVTYAQEQSQQDHAKCESFFVHQQPPHIPDVDQTLCLSGYALAFSSQTMGNIYSAEYLTKDHVESAKTIRRYGLFDNRDPVIRGYRNSGYDRGHMTPSGDMPDYNRQVDTFRSENLVPQTRELNSGKWNWIEGHVRQLATEYGAVYIVTGPYFNGRVKKVSDQQIWVPKATWKAVYIPALNQAGVYFCKNTHKPVCYIVSPAFFSQQAGIDPFPGLSQTVKEQTAPLPRMQPRKSKSRR